MSRKIVLETKPWTGRINDREPLGPSIDHEDEAFQTTSRRIDDTPKQLRNRKRTTPIAHWWLEILSCIIATALFLALVLVLYYFNNKAIPQWPSGLTINTIVALLSTLCRALTYLPLAEGLSQLKWNWFIGKQRPLRDITYFDEASRGAWGALRLPFVVRGRLVSMNAIASFVLVSGLGTSFLTQSTISYHTELHPADDLRAQTTISNATEVGWGQSHRHLQYSAMREIMRTSNQTRPTVDLSCGSADCNWPVFTSLGVCADQANVTHKLSIAQESLPENEDGEAQTRFQASLLDGNVSLTQILPERYYFGKAYITSNSSLYDASSNGSDFRRKTVADWDDPARLDSALSHLFVIADISSQETGPRVFRAYEMLLYLCLQKHNASVDSGVQTTKVVETNINKGPIQDAESRFEVGSESKVQDSKFIRFNFTDDNKQDFPVELQWLNAYMDDYRPAYDLFQYSLDSEFSFYTPEVVDSNGSVNLGWIFGSRLFSHLTYPAQDGDLPSEELDKVTWKSIKAVLQDIAQALTVSLRTREKSSFIETVQGLASTPQTVTRVQWKWLILLGAQIVLTIVFTAFIIWHTKTLKVDVVKSSNLAELMAVRQGFADKDAPGFDGGIAPRLQKTDMACLERDDDGWYLRITR